MRVCTIFNGPDFYNGPWIVWILPLENKEGMGSLYDRHRERVRSVDKLIGKWDGTGQGQVKERAPIPSTDISSSMEQLLMKTRGIVNKNKQQKHVAFYSVEYACMYNF
jgi:hypothetical protein